MLIGWSIELALAAVLFGMNSSTVFLINLLSLLMFLLRLLLFSLPLFRSLTLLGWLMSQLVREPKRCFRPGTLSSLMAWMMAFITNESSSSCIRKRKKKDHDQDVNNYIRIFSKYRRTMAFPASWYKNCFGKAIIWLVKDSGKTGKQITKIIVSNQEWSISYLHKEISISRVSGWDVHTDNEQTYSKIFKGSPIYMGWKDFTTICSRKIN